jgi:hypothetical protein
LSNKNKNGKRKENKFRIMTISKKEKSERKMK